MFIELTNAISGKQINVNMALVCHYESNTDHKLANSKITTSTGTHAFLVLQSVTEIKQLLKISCLRRL